MRDSGRHRNTRRRCAGEVRRVAGSSITHRHGHVRRSAILVGVHGFPSTVLTRQKKTWEKTGRAADVIALMRGKTCCGAAGLEHTLFPFSVSALTCDGTHHTRWKGAVGGNCGVVGG